MTIKFMTFNIQHCRDYIKRVIDIELMASTIKRCEGEIIGLNEVFGEGNGEINQAEAIAERLGYYYYYSKAIDHKGRPFGNAIISKYNFDYCETIMIPDPIRNTDEYYETRSIIKAYYKDLNLTVLTTHIGLAKSEKINAINTLVDIIKDIKTPIVLMGDFNIKPDEPTIFPIYNLLNDTLKKDLLSFPSVNPVIKIDYIFASKDLKIIDADIPRIVASDHLPHTATIKINHNQKN